MTVTGLDHVAIPTSDAERFLVFYKALGFVIDGEQEWRAGTRSLYAIVCGPTSRINVHPESFVLRRGNPEYKRGLGAEPGCGDLCFAWEGGIPALLERLTELGVGVLSGPEPTRRGGQGYGVSVYIRDPDDNLLEFISYDPADRSLIEE